MTIFLSIAFGLSLAVILLGFWADRSAITARINGANGLPILLALIVSFLGSLAVAVIAWLFDSIRNAGLGAAVHRPLSRWARRPADLALAELGDEGIRRRCRTIEADRSMADEAPEQPDLTSKQNGSP